MPSWKFKSLNTQNILMQTMNSPLMLLKQIKAEAEKLRNLNGTPSPLISETSMVSRTTTGPSPGSSLSQKSSGIYKIIIYIMVKD